MPGFGAEAQRNGGVEMANQTAGYVRVGDEKPMSDWEATVTGNVGEYQHYIKGDFNMDMHVDKTVQELEVERERNARLKRKIEIRKLRKENKKMERELATQRQVDKHLKDLWCAQ